MGHAFAERIIATLERAKHEHYSEPEGLKDCDSLLPNGPWPCDCGADKINAEIDALIAEIRQEACLPNG